MTLGIPKVTVVGAGNVGATTANRLVQKKLADVVLLDINKDTAEGKALDMAQSGAIESTYRKIIGTNNYSDTKDSDIVVITAGLPRKEGMTREDLLEANGKIVSNVIEQSIKHSPDTFFILVSNPLDVMTYLSWDKADIVSHRVMGVSLLDTARLRYNIVNELGVSNEDVQALVIGEHGDSMVPVFSHTTVAGEPISKRLSKDKLTEITERTKNGGKEIVDKLKTSSYYGVASCVAVMVDAIVNDRKKELPASAYLEGQYGESDVFIGVPVRLGKDGVEDVIELKLTAKELKAFHKSADKVRQNVETLRALGLTNF